MFKKDVTIIGTGSLGTALSKALNENGVEVFSVFNRSQEPLDELSELIQPSYSGAFPQSANQLGDIIFITTSDHSIKLIANKLAELSDNYFNRIFAHCSGTEPSSFLSALKEKGAGVAAFHPIQSFTGQSTFRDFNDIYFDLEGDKKAIENLKEIAKLLNANCIEVSPSAKPYLHAAGVTASNYLIALLEMAVTIAERGEIKRKSAAEALLPLVQTSLNNIKKTDNLNDALSGPVKRGDDQTVKKHINLLEKDPEIQQLYKQLGKLTVDIVAESDLSAEKRKELKDMFENE